MRVTTADLWSPAPGRVLCWDVTASGSGQAATLSLNQRNHLAVARAGEASVWMAAAFDVDGPIDVTALERAFQALVSRHSSLQIGIVADTGAADGSGLSARRYHPGDLRWLVREVAATTSEEGTRETLVAALTEGCRPIGYAAFTPMAISRRDRSTVVLGMDHLHCDAFSTALVVDELSALYSAFRSGEDHPVLAASGCFVGSITRDTDEPVRVWHDDERLKEWHAFAREQDFALPTFPLALGVAPGERVTQASFVGPLADAATTDALSAAARATGASTYAVVLAALAEAISNLGGPDRLATLAPVQTRTDEGARGSIGWYTTTVPITVGADTSRPGLTDAGDAVRRGVRLGAVPLDQVMATLPEPLRPTRRDVFMVSWIDYRHLPGAAEAAERNAHHISAATLADDVQLWISRTDAGLAVRVRHPGTETAHDVVGSMLAGWRLRLAAVNAASVPAT